MSIISKDSMLRNIFQIALCQGKLEVPEKKTINSKESSNQNNCPGNNKIYFESSEESEGEVKIKEESPDRKINHPNENELLQAFKEQIGSLKKINFTLLSRIEQRLCEKFKVIQFDELGYGTFNNYVALNEQVLFSNDIKFNLSSSETNDNKTLISYEELEQFILQTLHRSIDPKHIEQMVCYHYQIECFEQLGHGSFRSIFDSIKNNRKSKNTSIHYECMISNEIPLCKQALSQSFLKGNLS